MTIIRDGKEIELTEGEMTRAYYEQMDKFDIADILDYFDGFSDEEIMDTYRITREELYGKVPAIARRYRKYMYDDDTWIYSRDAAIDYVLVG